MKHIGRFFSIVLLMMASLAVPAQKATVFMGVKVDGSKSDVVRKLKSAGFSDGTKPYDLTGEVNGKMSEVSILTHKGKVWRIEVRDYSPYASADDAVRRYNRLIDVFRKDNSYTEYEQNPYTSETERTFFEEYIREGFYYAEFFQRSRPELYERLVSFQIVEDADEYRIVTCYDNIHNRPEERQ